MTAQGAWLLALDTATSRVVVATGTTDGRAIGVGTFPAEHRHGERLLGAVEALMAETGRDLASLGGIIVGTGPGAFTGLRVGLATAKTLAHELGVPIVGISTGDALLKAAAVDGRMAERGVLLLPAGPHDRVEVRNGSPARLLAAGSEPNLGATDIVIAVDLEGRAPEPALERGRAALDGLATALLHLGAARLRDGSDDPETLVPEYVTLPRGALAAVADGGVSWSPDRR